MQQLSIVHKKSINSNQKVVSEILETKDRRPGKGRVIALSRRVFRLQNPDIFYVESETSDNIYSFVRYNPSVFEWCSCQDNSIREIKCKHQFAIEYSIMKGTLKDIDKLPA